MAVIERLQDGLADRQLRRWERLGGPGPVLRWCLSRPWVVTLGVAVALGAVLGATFGVPPFSPLVLVVVLVAPLHPVLRAQQRAYERWRTGGDAAGPGHDGGGRPPSGSAPGDGPDPGPGGSWDRS